MDNWSRPVQLCYSRALRMLGLFFPYGFLLQALALLHFARRRPETYWLFIILMGGALGAFVYILVEVIPDAGLLRGAFQVFPRRKRIKELEAAVLDNPSVGNYEELGDLYLDDKQYRSRPRVFRSRSHARRRGRSLLPASAGGAGPGGFPRRRCRSRTGHQARSEVPTTSARRGCGPTPWPRSASARRRRRCLARSPRPRRCLKRSTTTRAF